MTERALYIAILIAAALIVGILYVLFGQLTVRRLRQNPHTKDSLGLEYVSGWDVINVAQALAFPMSWSKKLETGPLFSMHAKASVLIANTSRFDRLLARVFYWLLIVTGLASILLVILNSVGIF